MKKLLPILIFTLSALFGNAQIVFESNFDNWNDSLPNDWQGVHRQFIADSVEQWTDSPEFGTAAAELINEFGAARIMASTNVTLELGVYYNVEVWVRGFGQIRTGLNDAELSDGDGGFIPWNPYVTVNSSTQTSFVQQISPEQSTSVAEVLLSTVVGTVIVDRIEVSVGVAPVVPEVSIIEIQSNVVAGGESAYKDSTLIISGTVSAAGNFEYYLQESPGEWGGILVSDFANTPALGDKVTIEGTIFEFDGVTQMAAINEYALVSSGNPLVVTEVSNSNLNAESYESVLVKTVGECTSLPSDGFWLISDGIGLVKVGEHFYTFAPVLNEEYDVTGMVRYDGASFQFQIDPRFAADITAVVGLDDLIQIDMSIFPNPTSDILNVTTPTEVIGATMLILDNKGAVKSTQRVESEYSVLDLTGFTAGSYLLMVQGNGLVSAKTFIIK